MTLRDKILNPSSPVVFFEQVPPAADKLGAIEATLEEVGKFGSLVDAINVPEILDESRGAERTHRFVPRVEPRRRTLGLLGGHRDPQPRPRARKDPRQAGCRSGFLYQPDAV